MQFARTLLQIASLLLSATASVAQEVPDAGTLQALDAALRALRSAPDSEATRLEVASLYLKAGQNTNAAETLKQYLESHPQAPKILRLLALAYLRQEDYAAAKDAAERALRFGQRDSAGVEVLAMAQLGLQATDAAESLFREAVKLDPNSLEANLQLGLLYSKQHRNLEEAVRLLEKARSLQPDLAGTYAVLGSAYLQLGNARKAAVELEDAVRLAPDNAEPYYVLASAYRRLQDESRAKTALEAFSARKKADAEQRAREMRGRANYEEGVNLLSNTNQLDKAYELLTQAVREIPGFAPGYYRMAQVSYLKGDLPNALTSIREALRLNPLEPEYYYVLARSLEDTDPKGALDAIEKALNFRPGVPDFEDLRKELKNEITSKPPVQ